MKEKENPKCGQCRHCVLGGWWDWQKTCELSGFPVEEKEDGCISFLPRSMTETYANRI